MDELKANTRSLDLTDQVGHFSTDKMHSQSSTSMQNDHALPIETAQQQSGQPVRPHTAGSSVQWEEKSSMTRPLSVRNIRKSMLRQVGTEPSTTESQASSQTRKTKSTVLNFFSAKEPSSQALREYEDLLRKQQNQKKGRVSAVGMPMTAATKLPAHVPKVNSKWDGLPESTHRKQDGRKIPKASPSTSSSRLSSAQTSHGSALFYQTQNDSKTSYQHTKSSLDSPVPSFDDLCLHYSGNGSPYRNDTSNSSLDTTSLASQHYTLSSSDSTAADYLLRTQSTSDAQEGAVPTVNTSSLETTANFDAQDSRLATWLPFQNASTSSSTTNVKSPQNINQSSYKIPKERDRDMLSSAGTVSSISSQSSSSILSKMKSENLIRLIKSRK
ncbi:MAG: hypothetical protein LQ340_002004 [Diploschistes diacapsis]|nr:MAG: hypothetical protein LQ340_002004 [Diploschistes diacapsis]